MELVVRKNDLLKELSLLQGIVERKNTIPILANVLLDASADALSLLATDLDVGLRSQCEATVVKPGTLTLPAKKLFEIVNALPDTEIRIEEDKGGRAVTVAADRFESRMQTLPASEFPTPPDDGGASRVSLPGAAVKRMISHTRFAITSEDTRYFLNGAQLVLKPDSMTLVATDGHRLALVTMPRTGAKGEAETKVILREALKNAALPTLTLIGVQFTFLIGGTVIIERLFSYEGLGNMAIDAVINRDLPLIQGIVLIFALIFVLINLAVDMMYALLNPRLRHG